MRSYFACIALLGLLLAGCVPVNDPADPRNVEKSAQMRLIDYGNGVYYAQATGSDLGNTLSALSVKHPGQTITWGIAKTNKEGDPVGYFIHIAGKKGCGDESPK